MCDFVVLEQFKNYLCHRIATYINVVVQGDEILLWPMSKPIGKGIEYCTYNVWMKIIIFTSVQFNIIKLFFFLVPGVVQVRVHPKHPDEELEMILGNDLIGDGVWAQQVGLEAGPVFSLYQLSWEWAGAETQALNWCNANQFSWKCLNQFFLLRTTKIILKWWCSYLSSHLTTGRQKHCKT